LTAALFVLVALRFGWSWTLPAELLFVAGLVSLSFIDLDHMLLPKVVVYPVGGLVAASLVLAAAVQGTWHRLAVAAICAACEFALLFTINMVSPRSLGFGDVRFGPVIALALGWIGWRYAFWGFLGANLVGVVIGVALIAGGKAGRKTKVPFGVFLSAGAVLSIVFGGAIHYPA
jgi:leader peptidase (prepilin peptidase)/N-methyltransferase